MDVDFSGFILGVTFAAGMITIALFVFHFLVQLLTCIHAKKIYLKFLSFAFFIVELLIFLLLDSALQIMVQFFLPYSVLGIVSGLIFYAVLRIIHKHRNKNINSETAVLTE